MPPSLLPYVRIMMKTLVTDGFDGEMPEDKFEQDLLTYMQEHNYTREQIASVLRRAASLTVRKD